MSEHTNRIHHLKGKPFQIGYAMGQSQGPKLEPNIRRTFENGFHLASHSMQSHGGRAQIPGSAGEYGWSGAASTYFRVDPREAFIGILMAQYQPSGFYPIANDFRVAAYQAIVD